LFARHLQLAAFKPLLEGSVSEIDGRLDAEVRAVIEGGSPRLSGQATLRQGVLQVPAIGQRFHDISAKVEVRPDRIRVEDLEARGDSGRLKAHAEAKLDGLEPVAMTATLRIREKDKLPITLEGESIGDAWGSIVATYEADSAARKQRIQVDVRRFVIELPEAPPQGIQELDKNPHVRVGFRRSDDKFATVPLQPIEQPKETGEAPTTTTVLVNLGSVRVIKGQQAEVALGGKLLITQGGRLDVRGQIEARHGTLDISGKEFEIERATVAFTGGEPSNPTINAVARYDAPAGYVVYAEYTGTAQAGKLRLSSEPPLSQDEILTLLLFGTPDGSFGGGGNSDSLSTAVSVAGGTAAKGLNRALSEVTDLDVSARIDTSTGAPRPELVVQLTPRVAARVTQAIGEPTPGQSPDRTFLTVEFRFASAWSLSTMVGDRGASALDLVWRNRY
jgi:translocation and assembly module TamB